VQRFTDEFEPATYSAPLLQELCSRIAREGPISFHDFMESALYHPRHGYYAASPEATTRAGDFVTSPEVHPVFGGLVAKQLWQMWDIMSRPPRFAVVEPGAGRGLLARDILGWAAARDATFAAALHYRIVEQIPALRAEQQRTLGALDTAARVDWLDALPNRIDGCLLSNELIDAFPVHRVVRRSDDLFEVFVACDDGRLRDELRPLVDARIHAYFERAGVTPGDGCYAEVNLAAPEWITSAARALRDGFVLTFDYGYEAPQLYAAWRRDGTLLCSYRQSAGSDPYQRVGKQDMTASVDFTTLRLAGEAAGLNTVGYTDQASFLTRLGISAGVAAAGAAHPDDMEEYFARRAAVMALIDPARLGRIRVLAQSRGTPDTPLWGFTDE
jgi:SAM-dependent MidA family methyltransferase